MGGWMGGWVDGRMDEWMQIEFVASTLLGSAVITIHSYFERHFLFYSNPFFLPSHALSESNADFRVRA